MGEERCRSGVQVPRGVGPAAMTRRSSRPCFFVSEDLSDLFFKTDISLMAVFPRIVSSIPNPGRVRTSRNPGDLLPVCIRVPFPEFSRGIPDHLADDLDARITASPRAPVYPGYQYFSCVFWYSMMAVISSFNGGTFWTAMYPRFFRFVMASQTKRLLNTQNKDLDRYDLYRRNSPRAGKKNRCQEDRQSCSNITIR